MSHWNSAVAATSPDSMPANVAVWAFANVHAGLANDIETMNQYAELMYALTWIR